MRPPDTKVDAVVEHRHGVDIPDPYRWLEGDNTDPARMGRVTPEVAAWTDAQNAHTRAVLDALPGRAAIEDALSPYGVRNIDMPLSAHKVWKLLRENGVSDE